MEKKGYTYPSPIYLKSEQLLLLFWRGGNFKPTLSIRKDGEYWSEAKTLIQGDGFRPYIRFASNHIDTIYFSFTDGHPNESKNNIYCGYYRNGYLYRANGEQIKRLDDLPLLPKEIGIIYDAKKHGTNTWVWDMAVDQTGNPVIVYAVFESETDHRYYYSRWTGESWITNEITRAGSWFPQTPIGESERETYYSGGIILDPQDPSNVYLSRPKNRIFEIEHWRTTDYGSKWSSSAITQDSSKNNVRPFIARGHRNGAAVLLWMHGDYTHYTDYQTAIKIKLIE